MEDSTKDLHQNEDVIQNGAEVVNGNHENIPEIDENENKAYNISPGKCI